VVSDVDADAGSFTVTRGVLDTTPRAHNSGARVWGPQISTIIDEPRVETETLHTKAQTITGRGTLDIDDAVADSFTVTRTRLKRPYAPTALLIESQSYPATIERGTIGVAWSHRHRAGTESETPPLPTNAAAETETLVHDSGDPWDGGSLTDGDSYSIPDTVSATPVSLRVSVEAVRRDVVGIIPGEVPVIVYAYFESWQTLDATFDLVDA
jgi:hypothetical protein